MVGAMFMAVLLVIYLGFSVNYAWILISDASPLANAMGYALVVLPGLGAWGLVAELRFAFRAQGLMKRLEQEGLLPERELPRLPSGRPDRVVADAAFPEFSAALQANPDSWQAWLRLGLVYDACGDRRRARWAVRRAIALAEKP
jgi:hypothetical protein